LETCCGYGYDLVRVRRNLPSDFQGPAGRSWMPQDRGVLRPKNHKPISPCEPIPGSVPYAEKTTLPRLRRDVSEFVCVAATGTTHKDGGSVPGSGILTRFPFGSELNLKLRKFSPAIDQGIPLALGSTDPRVQLLFTWNPSPLQSSRISLEYLLLPPRSALTAAPARLHSEAFNATPHDPPTRRSIAP
jgi:hypothetical protein